MEIIDELERSRAGRMPGLVGYFSYDGSLDTCITIRTLVMQGQEVSVQAGAGHRRRLRARTRTPGVGQQGARPCCRRRARRKEPPMIAVIDNYDSFTYNLVQYFGELGAEVVRLSERRRDACKSSRR